MIHTGTKYIDIENIIEELHTLAILADIYV